MEDNTIKSKQNYIINVIYYGIGIAIYYFFFRYVIYKVWPFAIAALIALLLSGPAEKLSKKIRIPYKGLAAILVALSYIVIGGLIALLVVRIIYKSSELFAALPNWYQSNIAPQIQKVMDWYENLAINLNPEVAGYVNSATENVMSKAFELVTAISKKMLSLTQSIVVSLPGTIIGLIFCIIASFFMTMDSKRISHFLYGQLDERKRVIVDNARDYLKNGLGKIILSYGLIMCITCAELFAGFSIIGLDNPLGVAVLIAIFDILPALGTGGIVLPWTVIELIKGDYIFALKLFILYGIVTVVRNIIEPKIVGNSIGIHPVLMLMSIFLGASILGPLGIIILPFTLIVIKNLNDSGYIKLFKSDYLGKK